MPRVGLLALWRRPTLRVIACLTLGLLLGHACPTWVRAQTAAPAGLEHPGPMTPKQRAELYRSLERRARILEAQAAVVKTVAKLVGPAVVYIEADVKTPSYQRHRLEEAGSGVIIRFGEKNYVLTNRHVIRNSTPQGIKINLADGRQIHPTEVWGDADTDVAVMAVSAPELLLARIGDSDRMEVGDFVLAMGSPFGLRHSVTYGIISAKGRRDLQLGEAEVTLQDFIQTDAAINPGNSGGPLINLRGEVIGINTAIASNSGSNEGIGFAIPINMFMFFSRQLIEHGKVSRAFLGVNLDPSFGPEMAAQVGLPRPRGARVKGLTKGAPAEAASLQPGDVILEFNHVPVEDDEHLINLVAVTEIGTTIPLVIFRNRKSITVEVKVGDRKKYKPRR